MVCQDGREKVMDVSVKSMNNKIEWILEQLRVRHGALKWFE